MYLPGCVGREHALFLPVPPSCWLKGRHGGSDLEMEQQDSRALYQGCIMREGRRKRENV